MIRAVLFDVDGTLMDNNLLHVRAWKEAFAPYRALDEAELLSFIGMGSDLYVRKLAPNLDEASRQAIRDRKRALFTDIARDARPFPGTSEVLDQARRRGLKVALASSASGHEVRRYVDAMGIADVVDAITTASDVTETKPAPDLFLAALSKLGVPATDAFVVGDTPYDAMAASRAGMRTVGVLSGGFAAATLETAGAFLVLQDVGELARRFDEILEALQA